MPLSSSSPPPTMRCICALYYYVDILRWEYFDGPDSSFSFHHFIISFIVRYYYNTRHFITQQRWRQWNYRHACFISSIKFLIISLLFSLWFVYGTARRHACRHEIIGDTTPPSFAVSAFRLSSITVCFISLALRHCRMQMLVNIAWLMMRRYIHPARLFLAGFRCAENVLLKSKMLYEYEEKMISFYFGYYLSLVRVPLTAGGGGCIASPCHYWLLLLLDVDIRAAFPQSWFTHIILFT